MIVDRAIGHARGNGPDDGDEVPKVPVTTDTPFCVYSTSKGITALVVHMLVERGALALDDKIVDHIPEYAPPRQGGDHDRPRALASGRGRDPAADALDLDLLNDREALVELISTRSRPRSRASCSPTTPSRAGSSWARSSSGRRARRSATCSPSEFLDPLGFRWMNYGVDPADVDQVGLSYVTGPPLLPPVSNLVKRVLGAPIDEVIEISNDPRFLTGVIPAASTMTSANELSRFFEIFRRGGELDGVRVMKTETLRKALEEQSRLEIDLSLLFPTRFSYGLMLGAKVISLFGRDTDLAFGHLGLINIMGWADPERGISAALITSGKAILYPEVHRFYGVMQRIAAEVPKVPEADRYI